MIMASVLGIGGVFFKTTDPKKLADWYRDTLNMPMDPQWHGASFMPSAMPKGGYTVFGPFKQATEYFNPSDNPYMFNLVVDDLEQALAQVQEGGGEVVGDIMDEPYGRFGWFMDPDGNKVELWQPIDCGENG